MIDDGDIEDPGVLEGAPHELSIIHGMTVVTNRDGARVHHFTDLRQLLAALTLGDGPDWKHVGESGLPSFVPNESGHNTAVVGWGSVRHTGDARKAAGNGCPSSGRDGFFVLPAGLSQMHVHIDESGSNGPALTVNDLPTFLGLNLANIEDLSLLDEQIGAFVHLLAGIN
jgi:hypothetical protein